MLSERDNMQNVRTLIVEDDETVVTLLKLMLGQKGFIISKGVSTAEDAIEEVRHDSFDLIFMDIHLDGRTDGIEAAKIIRDFSDVPIVFISGYNSRDLIERALTVRRSAYVTKPFLLKQLLETVSVLID